MSPPGRLARRPLWRSPASRGYSSALAAGIAAARVRYVITGSPEDVTALLASLGLSGRARRVDAPGFVYRVSA